MYKWLCARKALSQNALSQNESSQNALSQRENQRELRLELRLDNPGKIRGIDRNVELRGQKIGKEDLEIIKKVGHLRHIARFARRRKSKRRGIIFGRRFLDPNPLDGITQ